MNYFTNDFAEQINNDFHGCCKHHLNTQGLIVCIEVAADDGSEYLFPATSVVQYVALRHWHNLNWSGFDVSVVAPEEITISGIVDLPPAKEWT